MYGNTRNKGTKAHKDANRRANQLQTQQHSDSDPEDVELSARQLRTVRARCAACAAHGPQGGVLDVAALGLTSKHVHAFVRAVEAAFAGRRSDSGAVRVLLMGNNALTTFPLDVLGSSSFDAIQYWDLSANRIKATRSGIGSFGSDDDHSAVSSASDDDGDDVVTSSSRVGSARGSDADESVSSSRRSGKRKPGSHGTSRGTSRGASSNRDGAAGGTSGNVLDPDEVAVLAARRGGGSRRTRGQRATTSQTSTSAEVPRQLSRLRKLLLLDLQGNPGYVADGGRSGKTSGVLGKLDISIPPALQNAFESRQLTILVGEDKGKVDLDDDGYGDYEDEDDYSSESNDDGDDEQWREDYYSTDDDGDVDHFYSNDGVGGRLSDDEDGSPHRNGDDNDDIDDADVEELSRRLQKQLTFTVEHRKSLLTEGFFRDMESSNLLFILAGAEPLPWRNRQRYEEQWDRLLDLDFVRYVTKRYGKLHIEERTSSPGRRHRRQRKQELNYSRKHKDKMVRSGRQAGRETKVLVAEKPM